MGRVRPLCVGLACLACSAAPVLGGGAGELMTRTANTDVVHTETPPSNHVDEPETSVLLDASDLQQGGRDASPDPQASAVSAVPLEAPNFRRNFKDLEGSESAFLPPVQRLGDLERTKRAQFLRVAKVALAAALFLGVLRWNRHPAKPAPSGLKNNDVAWKSLLEADEKSEKSLDVSGQAAVFAAAVLLRQLLRLALLLPSMIAFSKRKRTSSLNANDGASLDVQQPLRQKAEAPDVFPSSQSAEQKPLLAERSSGADSAESIYAALEEAESAFLPRIETLPDLERKKRSRLRMAAWLLLATFLVGALVNAGLTVVEASVHFKNALSAPGIRKIGEGAGFVADAVPVVKTVTALTVLAAFFHLNLRFALWLAARRSIGAQRAARKSAFLERTKLDASSPLKEKVVDGDGEGLPAVGAWPK